MNTDINGFLSEIVRLKEAEAAGIDMPYEFMMPDYKVKSLSGAVLNQNRNAVIAEIKFRSPSGGEIAPSSDQKDIADEYIRGGCTAISVLTDEKFFGGKKEYLTEISRISTVPLLRKDFIVDEKQLYETKIIGADAVLLIAKILGGKLPEFKETASALSLESLIEVRTEEEADLAISCGAEIIGINNRDLTDMKINLNKTAELSAYIRDEYEEAVIISESGYNFPKDLAAMKGYCNGFLIGSSLMKAKNRREAVEGFVCV
ncbi:indole-3-glycerol phosphate synthase TrpC [Methanoplanus endosymbiosus]|uniref:indole-3-glycerol-phosphate synthase n=1 Tax=Methanoplanus endosymbiosus TaxID=33865 RepID=A0A9E7THC1_9EURY|nr:indole-3-glycerol-phosphate synthase [Methanoplanus endosymbiosus]UUX92577.1 indole-3-glycerol-phosphate synthase [Methanoplanus endosymbiosus]